jgi:hypothetical protein
MIGSKYLIFVDEAGSPFGFDPNFPMFVLSFVIISKDEYVNKLLPKFCELKLKYFNHTHIVFHERDIRLAKKDFSILLNAKIRQDFMNDMNKLMTDINYKIINSIEIRTKCNDCDYGINVCFVLDSLKKLFGNNDSLLPVIFESRGKKEDGNLKAFIKANKKESGMQIIFSEKSSNGFGLQFADMVARPVGRKYLNPDQTNRAWDIIKSKIISNQTLGNVPEEIRNKINIEILDSKKTAGSEEPAADREFAVPKL